MAHSFKCQTVLFGPGSNSNGAVFYIPKIFKIEASPSDGLMSYWWGYPSAELQSVYSTASATHDFYAEKFLIIIYNKN